MCFSSQNNPETCLEHLCGIKNGARRLRSKRSKSRKFTLSPHRRRGLLPFFVYKFLLQFILSWVGNWKEPVVKNTFDCVLNDCGTGWPTDQFECETSPDYHVFDHWWGDPSLTIEQCKIHCWNTGACVGFSFTSVDRDNGPQCVFYSQYPETCATIHSPHPGWRGEGSWDHYISM